MAPKQFVTVINCMDGRVQLPVNEWLRKKFGIDYVDTITEAGPVRTLAEKGDAGLIDSIRRRVEVSATKHGSKIVAVVGHHDCAGNPLSKDEQFPQIVNSINTVKSWDYDVKVIGLWVDENWLVHEV